MWNAILKRNENLLADIYATKGMSRPKIMPVSSKGLMDAASEDDDLEAELNLESSLFPQVKAELIKMMFRKVGLLRTGFALSEAVNHVNKVQNFVNEMIRVCAVDAAKEFDAISRRKMNLQQSLQNDWGLQSQKRYETMNQIGNVCGSVMGRVMNLVSTDGPVCKEYMAKINAVNNMEQVKTLAKTLPQSVVNDVSSQWQSIAQQTASQVSGILSNVNTQIGMLGVSGVTAAVGNINVRELSAMEKLSCWKGSFFGTSITAGIGLALGALALPVIGGIVAAGGALLSWLFGKQKTKSDEVEQNKQNFRQKLYELLSELSTKLLQAQNGNSRSVVAQFTYELQSNAQDAIQSIFDDRQQQMQRQLADIERQANADLQVRRKDEEVWTNIRKEWDSVAYEIKQESELKDRIEAALR